MPLVLSCSIPIGLKDSESRYQSHKRVYEKPLVAILKGFSEKTAGIDNISKISS
jgi:hypothetical protein